MVKESIQHDNITFVYMYNICIFVYMYVLIYIYKASINILKGRNSSAIMVGDFNIPLKSMDRSSRQNLLGNISLK